jgi:hypothetical protein
MVNKTPTEELTQLHQEMLNRLGEQELRTLCFTLGVNYDDLPPGGRADKARELVLYCERRSRLPALKEKLAALLEGPQTPGPQPAQPPGGDRETLQRTLAMAHRALNILEEQAAGFGKLHVPAHLQIELEEKRRQVAELEARLTQPSQPTPAPSPAHLVSQHDVFLSYSRKDTDVMRRLLQDLRTQGLTVWVDETGLEPGTPAWESAVGNAIENARSMVVILSPDAKESTWVGRELSYAETHDVRIFPVLARGDERSAIPIRLTSAQYVDVRQDYAGSVQRLVATMRKHLGM